MRIRSREEWTHLWVDNPVYKGYDSWPIGWVFEGEGGGIVGHIANVPLSYEFAGRRILAATTGDLVVDSPYRLYAFQLLAQFLSQKQIDVSVHTTVNRNSSKALEAFRVPRVPVGKWDSSAFWITNHRGFVRCVLAKKRVPFARELALPLSIGLQANDKITKARSPTKTRGVELSTCTHFDERFDEFWEVLRRQREILLATRSREVLEWHFKSQLARNKVSILIATKGPKLVAYSVFVRYENTALELKALRLVDFQSLDSNNAMLIPMLHWALEACEADGTHMLEAFGFAPEKQVIVDGLAPHRRKLPSWQYFYKANNQTLADRLRDPSVWDPSCFDGDASL